MAVVGGNDVDDLEEMLKKAEQLASQMNGSFADMSAYSSSSIYDTPDNRRCHQQLQHAPDTSFGEFLRSNHQGDCSVVSTSSSVVVPTPPHDTSLFSSLTDHLAAVETTSSPEFEAMMRRAQALASQMKASAGNNSFVNSPAGPASAAGGAGESINMKLSEDSVAGGHDDSGLYRNGLLSSTSESTTSLGKLSAAALRGETIVDGGGGGGVANPHYVSPSSRTSREDVSFDDMLKRAELLARSMQSSSRVNDSSLLPTTNNNNNNHDLSFAASTQADVRHSPPKPSSSSSSLEAARSVVDDSSSARSVESLLRQTQLAYESLHQPAPPSTGVGLYDGRGARQLQQEQRQHTDVSNPAWSNDRRPPRPPAREQQPAAVTASMDHVAKAEEMTRLMQEALNSYAEEDGVDNAGLRDAAAVMERTIASLKAPVTRPVPTETPTSVEVQTQSSDQDDVSSVGSGSAMSFHLRNQMIPSPLSLFGSSTRASLSAKSANIATATPATTPTTTRAALTTTPTATTNNSILTLPITNQLVDSPSPPREGPPPPDTKRAIPSVASTQAFSNMSREPQDSFETSSTRVEDVINWEKINNAGLSDDDYVPLADYSKQKATQPKKPIQWETVNNAVTTDDDYVPMMDYSKNTPSLETTMTTRGGNSLSSAPRVSNGIKWEKVENAYSCDDDYVPMVDYSVKCTSSSRGRGLRFNSSSNAAAATTGSKRRRRPLLTKRKAKKILRVLVRIALVIICFRVALVFWRGRGEKTESRPTDTTVVAETKEPLGVTTTTRAPIVETADIATKVPGVETEKLVDVAVNVPTEDTKQPVDEVRVEMEETVEDVEENDDEPFVAVVVEPTQNVLSQVVVDSEDVDNGDDVTDDFDLEGISLEALDDEELMRLLQSTGTLGSLESDSVTEDTPPVVVELENDSLTEDTTPVVDELENDPSHDDALETWIDDGIEVDYTDVDALAPETDAVSAEFTESLTEPVIVAVDSELATETSLDDTALGLESPASENVQPQDVEGDSESVSIEDELNESVVVAETVASIANSTQMVPETETVNTVLETETANAVPETETINAAPVQTDKPVLEPKSDQDKHPKHCWIPFSHVHSKKCRHHMRRRPLFHAEDLLHHMMQ